MESKSQEWIEQTEAKIREVFELFDKEKTESIVQVCYCMYMNFV